MSELTDAASEVLRIADRDTVPFNRLRAALAADAQRSTALELAAQKIVERWFGPSGPRIVDRQLQHHVYELRDILKNQVSRVDWRARAIAHARALVSILVLKGEILKGTFGEQWLKEARDTIDKDMQEYTFAAGYAAANKDGTLKEEQ